MVPGVENGTKGLFFLEVDSYLHDPAVASFYFSLSHSTLYSQIVLQ